MSKYLEFYSEVEASLKQLYITVTAVGLYE